MQVGIDAEPLLLHGLHGTFTYPSARAATHTPPRPAALIIAGSGPTDRNGNGPGLNTDSYRLLAEGLATHGIGALRYDKRGIGESRALVEREEDVVFDDFVADAVKLAEALRKHPNVSSIFLIGHSEGAVIALAAAERAEARGIVLLASPGRHLLDLIRAQLDGRLPPELAAQAASIMDSLAAGRPVADAPDELRAIFRPSVQPFLISAARADPCRLIASLAMPILVIHGERDLQVGAEDIAALRLARPDAQIVILPQANHTLKTSPADVPGNLALYGDPSVPLDPDVIPAIENFIRTTAAN
jgi:uncharacterized protein